MDTVISRLSRLSLSLQTPEPVNFLAVLLILLLLLVPPSVKAQPIEDETIDVLHYRAQIEPQLGSKSLAGKVAIRFRVQTESLSTVQFNCGDLQVDSVREGNKSVPFAQSKHRLVINLPVSRIGMTRELEITYHGSPRYGVNFFPKQEQVYTVYSTSQWLVSTDDPADKASLQLSLIVPKHFVAVANGQLVGRIPLAEDKLLYQWQQNLPVPSYTSGFAAGRFQEISRHYQSSDNRRIALRYLAAGFEEAQLDTIFQNTPDMLRFFEQKAGIPYPDSAYSQVLAAGTVAQEMSSFAVIRENYGQEVLSDQKALWLLAHELAHQWWGNQVTCRNWNHFWLNEGMATFMSAAYKEHRFGRSEYLKDIEAAKARYLTIRKAGKDRSLVFPDWNAPSAEDRALVYQKGAYVLHLLREELGEKHFWQGIQAYTRTFWGKSVTTSDFQAAMEKAGGRSLSPFFAKWVYLTKE